MTRAAMLVLTTCASLEEADGLAASLVDARQAACVNRIGPVRSTYRWQGAVQSDDEVLLLIKTTEERLGAVQRMIGERSSYELPEFLAVRVETGSTAYLDWLTRAVTD
jgi:periplasmic divalent cation tolerance protein